MTGQRAIPRRRVLLTAAAMALPPATAVATPAQVTRLIHDLCGEAVPREGKVKLDLPLLVENGNTVAMTVSVDAPPGAVDSIHVFAEGNPLPEVARFYFGPRAGAPRVSTRIRLATSQTVTAIAKLRDGTVWRDDVDLLVTLAACIE
jgi:sulfur-oxidizing protein SoxY